MAADKNRSMGLRLALIGGLMLGASFAAVPFYRLFCQLTGFGGTAIRVTALPAPEAAQTRKLTVTFNADVDPKLPWSFKPDVHEMTVQVGVPVTTSYHVVNNSRDVLVGTATHNIQPDKASPYFNKVQCFCFTEQVLQPGEAKTMPVTFFIDPDMVKDRGLDDVQAITLSYTFFLDKDQSKAKAPPAAVAQNNQPEASQPAALQVRNP